jgi:HlyD family secretion protein
LGAVEQIEFMDKQVAATIQNQGTQQEVTNFEVRIQVARPDLKVRPGMSTTVEIETQTAPQVISVPISIGHRA